MPFIPPWLVGTDPVAMYAEGLRMGQSQAGEAARIQASQEAAMRENQRMAVEEQIRSQELGLRMQEQAARDRAEQRKQQALARYQMALATGVDPAKALLQVAPDLGESLTGAAQLYRATQPATMSPFQQAEIELRKEANAVAKKRADAYLESLKSKPEALDPIDKMDYADALKRLETNPTDEEAKKTIRRIKGEPEPPPEPESTSPVKEFLKGIFGTSRYGAPGSLQAIGGSAGGPPPSLVNPATPLPPSPRKYKLISIDGKPVEPPSGDQTGDEEE